MTVRLADRILADPTTAEDVRTLLRGRPPAILAANVADYFAVGTDQEVWVEHKDFPNVAPPFPVFWMEWPLPTHFKTTASETGELTLDAPAGLMVGALVHSFDLGDPATRPDPKPNDYLAIDFELSGGLTYPGSPTVRTINLPTDSRWACWAHLWIAGPDTQPMYMGALLWGAAADGTYRGELLSSGRQGGLSGSLALRYAMMSESLHGGHGRDTGTIELLQNMRITFYPGLLAISFLHCRNVEMRRTGGDRRHGKPKKNRHKAPSAGLRYHVLEIEPMRAVLRREGGAKDNGEGTKQALHICRGHFRRYTDKGLFGRPELTGTFWTPMHVRGSKARGEVVKDYHMGSVPQDTPPSDDLKNPAAGA